MLMLARTPALAAAIENELPADAALTAVPGHGALLACAGKTHPALVLLEWPADADNGWPAFVAELREHIGAKVPIVAVCRLSPDSARFLKDSALLGVSEALLPDRENVGLLVRAILNDRTGVRAELVVLRLTLSIVPRSGHPMLRAILAEEFRPCNVKTVAARMGHDRSKLEKDLRLAGGPKPKTVVALCTVGVAVVLLRSTPKSIAEVAKFIGSPRPGRFRDFVRAHTGLDPEAIRADGPELSAEEYLRTLACFAAPAPRLVRRGGRRAGGRIR